MRKEVIVSETATVVMVTKGSVVCRRYSSDGCYETDIPRDAFPEGKELKEGDQFEVIIVYGKNGNIEKIEPAI